MSQACSTRTSTYVVDTENQPYALSKLRAQKVTRVELWRVFKRQQYNLTCVFDDAYCCGYIKGD